MKSDQNFGRKIKEMTLPVIGDYGNLGCKVSKGVKQTQRKLMYFSA